MIYVDLITKTFKSQFEVPQPVKRKLNTVNEKSCKLNVNLLLAVCIGRNGYECSMQHIQEEFRPVQAPQVRVVVDSRINDSEFLNRKSHGFSKETVISDNAIL